MEKKGTKLEGKWRCEKARHDQEVTTNILNFLMDSNIKLSDEVLRKKQSFERMKTEAEKCLRQSEQFKNEKQQFETDIFRKFVAVLNSKKSKLRELRDKLAKFEPTASRADDEEETDADESDEEDANDKSNNGDGEAANMAGDGQIAHETPSPTAVTENKPQTQVAMTENKHQTQAAVPENKPWTQAAKVSEEHGSGMAPDQDRSSVKTVIDSAAALLGDSDYTSAPKRRRRV
ncbi:hypothetical protein KP509_15G048300 [Ceratopteris richardii]|nr:hypothetical protein KP509_15G048300 [Ceratopteris richardii]